MANMPPLLIGLPCGASGEPVFSSAMGVMNQLPIRMASNCSPFGVTSKAGQVVEDLFGLALLRGETSKANESATAFTRSTAYWAPSARNSTPVFALLACRRNCAPESEAQGCDCQFPADR
jgi:hypothetical protein